MKGSWYLCLPSLPYQPITRWKDLGSWSVLLETLGPVVNSCVPCRFFRHSHVESCLEVASTTQVIKKR